ncbi:MAG: hypothetical protein RLO81_07865 [Fulvivirga sp.]|uniref:hypothetical protein n=1 Tax=Fulvivirga sp. TaxID=1931237 RepID=UPI0032F02002
MAHRGYIDKAQARAEFGPGELANMAGLDRSYISRIERFLISPTLRISLRFVKLII